MRRAYERTEVPRPVARTPSPSARHAAASSAAGESEAVDLGRALVDDRGRPGLARDAAVAARPRATPAAARLAARLDGRGKALPDDVQATLGRALGHDFSRVRIHDDRAANSLASSVHARAFTVANHVVLGAHAGTSQSITPLLAHEAVHIVQQRGGAAVQRQEIPSELVETPDYSKMTDDELQERHDLIIATLKGFTHSTPETAVLHEAAAQIGIELGGRRALAAGRTFSPEAIERMRAYFKKNAAAKEPAGCITALNQGVRLLLDDPKQPVAGEIQTTMPKLQAANRAGAPRVIEFNDASGRMTGGVREPVALRESVWDAMIAMAGGDPGWSVFGLSIMDGYHAVTLTLDNRDPRSPRVFWSDQYAFRRGWQELKRTTLDAEVTKWTRKFWGGLPVGGKHPPRATLWRLRR